MEEYFDGAPWDDDWNPRYNIAPTQLSPALVTVSSGEHVVSVQLSGYQPWQRKLQTSTGKVTISAMLQAGTAVTPAVQSKSSSTPAVTPIAAQATTVVSCNTSDCVHLGSAAKKAKAAKQAQSNSTQTPQQ